MIDPNLTNDEIEEIYNDEGFNIEIRNKRQLIVSSILELEKKIQKCISYIGQVNDEVDLELSKEIKRLREIKNRQRRYAGKHNDI